MSSTTTELADLQRALGQLRTSVGALRSRYGDVNAVRRISNDVERLGIDIAELTSLPVPRGGAGPGAAETVIVPDTPYDSSLWRDADDEGVGGQRGY
ncbi:hypothetical protein A8924_1564 [Saccharopolyspora erythraea NRRL 2338]|uniref:Uncharacterized protein n=2 Tax=Saccharopolyspora erythraea TaxID=1836 RepID=A4F8X1_SACEN|nr:hypothetical protein [Saccharopolyspora erythraea]PFG94293.1 hypothetical protein A8924_1564 [Saccharopolyspora erythraea NRRL 2338]QRK91063.1 hypothetical protein JQX30_06370 [Saccharopolyspora erythraea]CAM00496.1 hypothetical protein SACE_1168 [Saccharopolyspora erythraea NRRL 2338]